MDTHNQPVEMEGHSFSHLTEQAELQINTNSNVVVADADDSTLTKDGNVNNATDDTQGSEFKNINVSHTTSEDDSLDEDKIEFEANVVHETENAEEGTTALAVKHQDTRNFSVESHFVIPEIPETQIDEARPNDKDNIEDPIVEVTPDLPKFNRRALSKDCETYMLETFKQNVMIIFNHEFVDGYDQRKGTDEDVKSLRRTFEQFRFKITEHKDQVRKRIGELMVEFSDQDFTEYGCVAIAILTHGSVKGGLRAKDKKYREQQILKLIKENPTLATKPILYIIQACRGDKVTSLVDVTSMRRDNVQYTEQYKLPMEADTLVLHSTYDGTYSYRNEEEGSWFIQTLCEEVNNLADTEDFETIMTTVKRKVAIHKETKRQDPKTKEYEFNKQMPVSESTLIRKLYLKRNSSPLVDPLPIENVYTEPDLLAGNVERESISTASASMIREIVASDQMKACQVCLLTALERFDYVIKALEYYIAENAKDAKARRYMIMAKPYLNNSEAEEAKMEIAKDIRDHLRSNAVHSEKYKFLYVWNDFDDLN